LKELLSLKMGEDPVPDEKPCQLCRYGGKRTSGPDFLQVCFEPFGFHDSALAN